MAPRPELEHKMKSTSAIVIASRIKRPIFDDIAGVVRHDFRSADYKKARNDLDSRLGEIRGGGEDHAYKYRTEDDGRTMHISRVSVD